MLFAGFNVSRRRVQPVRGRRGRVRSPTWWAPGSPTGSATAGRVDILEKHGKKLHIKKSHLEWADRWFERHGDATVFFTRMLPIIRTFISLPAGVARMPFWRFSAAHARRLHAVGVDAHLHRQAGRRQLGELEGQPPLRGLRRGRGDRGRRRLPDRAPGGAAPGDRPAPSRPERPERAAAPPGAWRSALLQGPAELVPVSSSAHLALVPRLLGWRYAELDAPTAQDVRGGAARRLGAGAGCSRCGGEPRRAACAMLGAHAAARGAGRAGASSADRGAAGRPAHGGARPDRGRRGAAGWPTARPQRRARRRTRSTTSRSASRRRAALVPGRLALGAALTAARLRGLSRAAGGARCRSTPRCR